MRSLYFLRFYKILDDLYYDFYIFIFVIIFLLYLVLIFRLGINFRNVGKEIGFDLVNVFVVVVNDRFIEYSCVFRI